MDWVTFRFSTAHNGVNRFENVLAPGNVGQLKLLWPAPALGNVRSSPAVVDGVLYVGDEANGLNALNATTGEEVWRLTLPSDVGSSPAVRAGVVYGSFDFVGSGNQSPSAAKGVVYVSSGIQLFALDARSGTEVWHMSGGPQVHTAVAVSAGGRSSGTPPHPEAK